MKKNDTRNKQETPAAVTTGSVAELMARLQATARPLVHTTTTRAEAVDFRLMIKFDRGSRTRAIVDVVDAHGKPIVVDSRDTAGPQGQVMRGLEEIEYQRKRQVWGGSDNGAYLCRHPLLLERLMRCPNLVDEDMNPLQLRPYSRELQLELADDGENYRATFAVADDERGRQHGVRLLSDQWAMAGGCIYPIKPLGEQFEQMPQFEMTFAKDQLGGYLSVLYSYLTGVAIHGLPYKVRQVEAAGVMAPTLVFESVDSDMTLNMRLTVDSGTDDMPLAQQAMTARVDVNSEAREVVVRHIESIDLGQEAAFLRQVMAKCAPSRAALKELYIEHGGIGDDGLPLSADHYFYSVPPALASAFLTSGLPSILGRYHLVGSDKLLDFKVRPVRPTLNVSLSSGIDFLEGTATVDVSGEQMSVHDLIAQYQKNHYVTLTDGNRALIDDKYMQQLSRLFSRATRKDGRVKISFFDLPEVEAMLGKQLQGKAMERSHKVYAGFNALAGQRMTFKNVNATLRNYQKEGVKWINYLYENKLGGCLADDMGLGKTLQAIAMLARIYPKQTQPSLIVMPRSLLFNWENELRRFAPQLTFTIYYGQQRDLDQALKSNLVLTTYALVRNDAERLIEHEFHYVILDESQNIKNVSAQSTRAVTLLKARHRLALSGTPIENNLTELYSLFRFLNPAMFGSLDDFNKKYTLPIQRDGDTDIAAALRRKVFPFILRRLKGDVLTELPPRTDQTLTVEMSPEHAKFYEQRRHFFEEMVRNTVAQSGVEGAQFMMFRALSELRQAASIPESLTDGQVTGAKIEPLLDSLTEATSNGHKAVVFFNFIAGLELVGEKLDKLGIDYAVMTGSTTDRRTVVERFQNDPQCQVMLMTIKTGGVGLNLTVADTVYIFEPWWNKAAEEQAINRLHRIGQTANVLSYSVVVHGTIEDKIRQLQQRKVELTDAIISSDSAMAKHLSEEDIKFILS